MFCFSYMAMNDLSEAAQVLSRTKYQEGLSLAADIAKAAGRTSFADHVESRKFLKAKLKPDKTEEILKALPSKIELLMKESKEQTGDDLSELNDGTSSDATNEDTENKE